MKRSILILVILFFNVSPAQEFRFAVWGDSQFQNPEVFEETVKRTELLHPDFVIHVGDMIHGYTYSIDNARKQWQRFKKQISPLTVTFYPTPGNHDVTTKEIQPAYLETWGNDKLYYSFDYLNSHFIILNTYLNQEFDTIPPVEMAWLKKDFEESKNKENVFVSMHSPLHLNKNYDWQPVHDLFKQYNVKAVFSGHYHYYDYKEIDGIKYFCLNSSGNMEFYNDYAGRSHHFLWVTVKGKDINASVITRDKFYPSDYLSSVSLPDKPEKDGTIIINDPAKGLDTTIFINLNNSSSFTKLFQIKPVTNDFRWKFPWNGFRMILEPGKQQKLPIRISFPGGNVEPGDMPEIQVTTEINYGEITPYSHSYKLSLFNPPVIYAEETYAEIFPDGLDNETVWKSVNSIDELYVDRENNPAEEKTSVKVLYDENNLYVHVKGEEPNVKGLTSAAYGEIPLVFGDDDFELYFDTDRDLKTFFRLMVNPKGTVLCSGPEGLFSFNFDVKTYTGDNYWSAEFKIPLQELNIFTDIKGAVWGFNIRRHRQQAEIPQSDWSKMNTFPPYQPEYFGLLKFN